MMDPKARIKALCDQGNSVDMDTHIPLKRYYRSGMEMVKMAKVYEEEGNLESAFILYIRFMTLFVEKIRNHPEFRVHSSPDKTTNTRKLKEIFPIAEKLKARIKDKYQKEYDEIVAHQKLVEEQLRLEQEEALRRKQKNGASMEVAESTQSNKSKYDKMCVTPYDGRPPFPEDPTIGRLVYPTNSLAGEPELPMKLEECTVPPPSYEASLNTPFIPSRELKPSSSHSLPLVDRGSKPLSLLCANLDNKNGGLRTIVVPEELLQKFLNLASMNTFKNVETCGILAGKLAQNKLLISHLLVPQQVGTPDSCTTQHEEELFDHQDKYDLITLGWIHTHPSQTAFLSSVDLHTHCSYQLMMPEAVAIVCAPKFQETGYFALTPNYGLSFIANCRENGFHPHPSEPPLFQAADHVVIDSSLGIQVIDMRR